MGKRSRGRQRNRWTDEVLKDTRVLGVKSWTKVAMDRPAWHDLMEKSKTHTGLQDERQIRSRTRSWRLSKHFRYILYIQFTVHHYWATH